MKAYLAELVQAAPTPAHGRNVAREYLQARIPVSYTHLTLPTTERV